MTTKEAMTEASRVATDKTLPVAERKKRILELHDQFPIPAIAGWMEMLIMAERA